MLIAFVYCAVVMGVGIVALYLLVEFCLHLFTLLNCFVIDFRDLIYLFMGVMLPLVGWYLLMLYSCAFNGT